MNRKRRPRGRGARPSSSQAAEHQAKMAEEVVEDAQTFWARSDARLGVDPNFSSSGRRGTRQPVEFPCAVCGVWVMLERWPKNRHEVRCDECRAAVGGLLTGEEREIAAGLSTRDSGGAVRYEGLPEMSDEDLEAVAEMRAQANLGNGRSANRRRPGAAAPPQKPGKKKKKPGGGQPQAQAAPQPEREPEGEGEGGRRRRRRRSKGKRDRGESVGAEATDAG